MFGLNVINQHFSDSVLITSHDSSQSSLFRYLLFKAIALRVRSENIVFRVFRHLEKNSQKILITFLRL